MVKISFVVPLYNIEAYAEECIISILNQTEKDIEIILVDDGSTDKTAEICDGFAKKDDRITVIHKINGGPSEARLSGFKKANGKYLLFIDGDDYIEPEMAESLYDSAEKNDADVVMCGYYTNYRGIQAKFLLPFEDGTVIKNEDITQKYIQPFIGTKKGGINLPRFLCFKLYKRELIEESYFKHEEIFYSEDVVFNLLYTDKVDTIAVVNKPFYHYRCVNNSLSNRYRKNKWFLCKNLYYFLNDYLEERQISFDNERLMATLRECIFVCIDNAVMKGKYRLFLKDIRQIRKDKIINLNGIKNASESKSVKISLALFKMRIYLPLYVIRKYRLKIASRL
ncbi:MAG: glycosyltransferase [Clostridia bacterium]|nr:glycosyltransferase [Clostridia bacterium]